MIKPKEHCSLKFKRFKKDNSRKYMKRYCFVPSFLYPQLDKWLEKMSSQGWHIVDCNLFSFTFEKGKPLKKIYFTFSLGTFHRNEGYFDILLRYPTLETTYGVKRKLSKINANEAKAYQIIEIDTARIDVESNMGYRELMKDRNKLYVLKAVRNAGALLLVLGLSALIILTS